MSSRSLRRVLSVSLVMAFLSLGSPASAASAFFARPEASFWALAWQWLAEQISPALEEEPAPPAAAPADEADRGDAGWILDPNG